MGTITGISILQRAMRTLNDPNNVRWTLAELLEWLNDGQREVAVLRPNSSTAVAVLPLDPGTTLQHLPTNPNAVSLIDITRNLGTDGSTPGAPVRIIAREELDLFRPTWHSDTAATAIQNYTYDGRSPRNFYVYPRPATAISVEAHLQVVPQNVEVQGVNDAPIDTNIALDDLYQTALYDYVMFRAMAKNTDAKNDGESMAAYRAFLNRLGLKLQVDRAADPNRNSPPQEPKRGPQDAQPAF